VTTNVVGSGTIGHMSAVEIGVRLLELEVSHGELFGPSFG
jgi:hypothetical protein